MSYEFTKPSLITRIAIGKAAGLLIGAIVALSSPALAPDLEPMIRWGMLLWYPTMGAFIGVFGILTQHPVLALPLPWWVRAPLIGAWMNFVLVFFTYDEMLSILYSMTGAELSPFWLVLEGAIAGGIIGAMATRYGGEGPDTVRAL